MLNKKELLLVNEVVKAFDNTCYVVANDKEIIIKGEGLTDETFTNRNKFLNEYERKKVTNKFYKAINS